MFNKSVVKGWLKPPFFFILFAHFGVSNAAVQPYVIVDSFSYSETVSIKAAIDGWNSQQFESGEHQWTWNWIELGVKSDHWGVGLLQRFDYDLRFSEQAAEFYWATANKKALPTDKEYQVWVEANAFHSSGLRVSFSDRLTPGIDYKLGLSYLYATYMVDGVIHGNATVLNESDYDYDAEVSYHYSEDLLFDRSVEKPTGHGFSIDAELSWQLDSATQIDLQVRDLLARIYWQHSPYTNGKATSDRKEYDDNGYVSINPVLSGFEGTDKRYTQHLDPRWYARLGYAFNDKVTGELQCRYQYRHGLFGVGASHLLTAANQIGISYWPINRALEVNWQYQQLKLGVTADQLSLSELKTLWLSFSYNTDLGQ